MSFNKCVASIRNGGYKSQMLFSINKDSAIATIVKFIKNIHVTFDLWKFRKKCLNWLGSNLRQRWKQPCSHDFGGVHCLFWSVQWSPMSSPQSRGTYITNVLHLLIHKSMPHINSMTTKVGIIIVAKFNSEWVPAWILECRELEWKACATLFLTYGICRHSLNWMRAGACFATCETSVKFRLQGRENRLKKWTFVWWYCVSESQGTLCIHDAITDVILTLSNYYIHIQTRILSELRPSCN